MPEVYGNLFCILYRYVYTSQQGIHNTSSIELIVIMVNSMYFNVAYTSVNFSDLWQFKFLGCTADGLLPGHRLVQIVCRKMQRMTSYDKNSSPVFIFYEHVRTND